MSCPKHCFSQSEKCTTDNRCGIRRSPEGRLCETRSPEEYGCGIRSGAEDIHAYSEGRRRSPSEYDECNIRHKPCVDTD